jgi:hypothetical protein
VTQGFVDLSKKMENLSKKGVGIPLDPETKKFMSGAGEQILRKLNNQLAEARHGVREMVKDINKSPLGMQNANEAVDHFTRVSQNIRNVERSMQSLSTGRGGQILMGLLGRGASALGVGGNVVSGAQGLAASLGGVGGVVAGGAVLGLGAFAYGGYKMAQAGLRRFDEQAPDRMKLYGFGYSRQEQDLMIDMGRDSLYGPSDTLKQMTALAQVTGKVGLLPKIQQYSKAFGMDPSQMIGTAGDLRQMGFSGKDLNRQFANMMGEAVATKIERSRLGELWEQSTAYISQIAQNSSVDPTKMMELIRNVMGMGGNGYFGTPAGAISGINMFDSYIKNAAKGGMGLGVVSSAYTEMFPNASANEKVIYRIRYIRK